MRKLAALVAMNLVIAFQVVNSQNPLYNYFPDKIKILVAFKPLEIGGKIPADVFKESPLVKSASKEKNDELLGILGDIKSIGIHLDEAFLLISEGSQPGTKITHLLAKLEDPSAFKNFLIEKAKMEPGAIRTYGTDNVIFPDEETVVAWNNKVLILVSEKGNYDMEETISDTLTGVEYEKWYEESKEKKQKALRNLAFELLTPRPGNAFTLDPKFQALMNEPGELKVWNEDNEDPFGKFLPAPMILAQLSRLTTGLKTTAIEFAAGKIIVRTRAYPSEEMAALMEKNPPAPAGEEFLGFMPEGKILAIINGSISNALMKDLFNKPVFAELADSVKKYSSFDFRQLPSIFGDKIVGAVVFNKDAEPAIDLVIGVPIRDLAGFKALQSEAGRLIDSLRQSDNNAFTEKFRPVVRSNDKMLAFSLSEKTAENFLAGKNVQSIPGHLRAYAKHPAMIHLDLPELIKAVMISEGHKTPPEELSFLGQLKDIRIYGGEFVEGATVMTAEVNFSDPAKNSLAQIFGIANGFLEMITKNKSSSEEAGSSDVAVIDDETGMLRYLIPELKDENARKFLEEYTEVVISYLETLSDTTVDIEAKKKFLLWEERARVMAKNITDKEDAEKFSEFLLLVKRLREEEEEE